MVLAIVFPHSAYVDDTIKVWLWAPRYRLNFKMSQAFLKIAVSRISQTRMYESNPQENYDSFPSCFLALCRHSCDSNVGYVPRCLNWFFCVCNPTQIGIISPQRPFVLSALKGNTRFGRFGAPMRLQACRWCFVI